MRKNFKLAYLFNLFVKHDAEDVIDAGDSYIDLFYNAMREASKEDLEEVIYQLINSKVYNTDWEDIVEELDDNGIFEKIENDDENIYTFKDLKEQAEIENVNIFFIRDNQEWLVQNGDILEDAWVEFDYKYNLEGNKYYLITDFEGNEEE